MYRKTRHHEDNVFCDVEKHFTRESKIIIKWENNLSILKSQIQGAKCYWNSQIRPYLEKWKGIIRNEMIYLKKCNQLESNENQLVPEGKRILQYENDPARSNFAFGFAVKI